MYDFIGDIHGHADELEALLKKMSYEKQNGIYKHPDRKAIFVGDLIDRGPKIKQVIETVRPMVEAGTARIVMGNHEFNAICYHTKDPLNDGEFLRPHSIQNTHQHSKTLEAFPNPDEISELIQWFYSIPLWLEEPDFRVVHASWNDKYIELLKTKFPNGHLIPELLPECANKDGVLYDSIETILKGSELQLPDGYSFLDKDGHSREAIRVKWFRSPKNQTYRSYSLPEQILAPEIAVVNCDLLGYQETERPIFFGHYWLPDKEPKEMAKNCFCLDYSVAKGGFLCAYRMGIGFMN